MSMLSIQVVETTPVLVLVKTFLLQGTFQGLQNLTVQLKTHTAAVMGAYQTFTGRMAARLFIPSAARSQLDAYSPASDRALSKVALGCYGVLTEGTSIVVGSALPFQPIFHPHLVRLLYIWNEISTE